MSYIDSRTRCRFNFKLIYSSLKSISATDTYESYKTFYAFLAELSFFHPAFTDVLSTRPSFTIPNCC